MLIKYRIKKILQVDIDYIKTITLLASGSLIAQIISIIVAPITSRLFTPEEFGTLTLVLTIANIFSPILSLRYEQLIVTVKTYTEVFTLVKLCFILNGLISFIVTICYLVYYKYHNNEDAIFLSIIIFSILILNGLLNIMYSFNNRLKEYKLITIVSVVRTLAQQLLSIFCGLLKLGTLGLILSNIFGLFWGMEKQIKSLISYKDEIRKIKLKEIKNIAYKYKRQPIFSVPSTIANGLSYSLINVMVNILFGTVILGYYSLSFRMLGLPLGLISNNVSRVFYESAAREYELTGNFKNSFKKTLLLVSSLAVPMIIILMLFGIDLFKIFFGENWGDSGKYVVILAPMYGVRLIASSLGVGIIIAQKQNYELLLQILLLSVSVVCYIIANIFNFTIENFLILISCLYSIIYLMWIIVVGYQANKKGDLL